MYVRKERQNDAERRRSKTNVTKMLSSPFNERPSLFESLYLMLASWPASLLVTADYRIWQHNVRDAAAPLSDG